MCELSIVTAGLSAIGTGLGVVQEQAARRAQEQERRRDIARRQAEAVARYGEIQADQVVDARVQDEKIADEREEGLRRRATARTARGEAGVSGLSVDALERDIAGRSARTRERLRDQRRDRQNSFAREALGVQRQTQAALDRLSTPAAGPDVAGAGLQIAKNVAQVGFGLAGRGGAATT